ncbi:MAG TPA: serine hydrolase domain-containing protein [Gemmatimonadaceae bacterium]
MTRTVWRRAAWCVGAAVAMLLLPSAVTPVHGALAPAPDPYAEIVGALEREMHERGVPGASIAIVVGDSVVLLRALGVRSVETGDPMTPSSLVRIGSVTKMVTGLASLLAEHDGRLALDAPIGRTVPELAEPLRALTMRQLLTHTAGLGNEGAGTGSHDESALAERVRGWGRERILAPAGDVYSYSSPGYWLAGHVLERADGGSYVASVGRRVLAPLGMTRSTFLPTVAMTHALAVDHRRGEGGRPVVVRPYPDDASTWPSGSLFSSAEELARLAVALLNDGRVGGRQLLPPGVVRHMLEPQVPTPGGDCSYAFGLSICGVGDARVARHYGFRGGSGAVFALVPARRLAVIVLANGPGAIMGGTEQAALDRLAPMPALPPTSPAPVASPAVAALLGRYANGGDTLQLLARGDSLRYRYGGEESVLTVDADGSLLVGPPDAPVQGFVPVRGRTTGRWYLHDGLSAFAPID